MELGEGFPIGEEVTSLPHQSASIPDYFDWVLGWRHFNIDDDGTCHSVSAQYIWQPGENRAECGRNATGEVVHEGHHCGLNCFYEPTNVMYGSLHALVRGRGDRFAIHPNGFRAEYAEIIAFVGGRHPSEKLKQAAKLHGVPLFKRTWQAERYAKRKGLGEFFPKDRRPKGEKFFQSKSEREVDWNEIPIEDTNYLFFVTMLWVSVLIGFITGGIVTIGGW
jgi:hypothetical protein